MVTRWDYSPELEARRLLHCAHQIATGFFRLNGFIVMPLGSTPASEQIVTLPDLPYLSIPRFWDRASRLNIHSTRILYPQAPADLVGQTTNLLSSLHLPPPDTTSLKSYWDKHQNQIMAEIYKIIPSSKNAVKTLTIWPTNFGTSCSFGLCDPKAKNQDIAIWLRSGQDTSAIIEAVLSSLTRTDVRNQLDGLWSESEIIVDWLLAFSPLAKFCPQSPKTIKSTRNKQTAALLQESEEFLKKIGASVVSPRSVDTSTFTPREKDIFNLLLNKSPHIVTFDELSLSDPENFSLYAISKSIQRLRDKLESSGISGSFIQTKRGEGYLLVN